MRDDSRLDRDGRTLLAEGVERNHSLGDASDADATVVVVDDDPGIRSALNSLLRSAGYSTALYATPAEFLSAPLPDGDRCLVLDVRLPQIDGFDVQRRLAERGETLAVVFVTGFGNVAMGIRAMKTGAVDFLEKPFAECDILAAVEAALSEDRARRLHREKLSALRARYATLTPRERQVMRLVSLGLMNKQVAAELAVGIMTVKLHRGSLMRKMGARSLPDLVRASELILPSETV